MADVSGLSSVGVVYVMSGTIEKKNKNMVIRIVIIC